MSRATRSRNGASKRLRFGAFLVLAIFAAIALASQNGAAVWPPSGGSPSVPWGVSTAVNGHGYVSDYQVLGAGGSTTATGAFSRSLVCSGCSVSFDLTASSLSVAGGGQVGILAPGKTYHIGNYHGHVGVSVFGPHDFALTLDGVAEKVRVETEAYPYAK